MDLSQVKLVVSDMDGTLLNDQGAVSSLFFEQFEQLKKHNVQFVAASGRQYYSMIHKLEPIKDEITIIAENGGMTVIAEEVTDTCTIDTQTVHDLIRRMRKIDDAHIVLCGKKQAYVESKHDKFLNIFNEYYFKYDRVEDLTQIEDDDFFKIAVYSFGGSETTTYPEVRHLEDKIKAKVSGENWLDLSHLNTDKGRALKILQNKLNISKEETMVFGDYNNDIEMMELAHFSYAMQNAHPNITKAANYSTKSNNEGGVEYILSQLIEAKEQLVTK
ncbi:HAD family hydrolase [Leeuwenhoekiella sp. W20_SRS_FM14]|uniref:HAD family hydrolase n=1 Tax=Leeuwenhoekiella sp. W20_SRS_FM14 TaxID=3240270 RepID=UPI003F9DCDDB